MCTAHCHEGAGGGANSSLFVVPISPGGGLSPAHTHPAGPLKQAPGPANKLREAESSGPGTNLLCDPR